MDLVDEVFGEEPEEEEEEYEYYPGSRRKRREPVEDEESDWQHSFTFIKKMRGQDVPMYTIGALAAALHRQSPTIREWIRKGYIPRAPYRLPATMIVKGENVEGRRLYTKELIVAVVDVFALHGLMDQKRITWPRYSMIPIEISASWNRIIREAKQQGAER